MNEAEQFALMQTAYPDAQLFRETNIPFVSLPKLSILSNGGVLERDALLCPHRHSGYESRLFVSSPVPGRGANWTQHTILARSWHSCSWNNITPEQPWLNILANHLAAYR